MLGWGCVVAYVIVGLTVKSRILDLHSAAKFDTHPANEGAYYVNRVADIPS